MRYEADEEGMKEYSAIVQRIAYLDYEKNQLIAQRIAYLDYEKNQLIAKLGEWEKAHEITEPETEEAPEQ